MSVHSLALIRKFLQNCNLHIFVSIVETKYYVNYQREYS